MNTVWKFYLTNDVTSLEVPRGAKFLHVDFQNSMPCVWALVDTEAQKETRLVLIVGTGHEINVRPVMLDHIGSFLMKDGALVFHAFEVMPLGKAIAVGMGMVQS